MRIAPGTICEGPPMSELDSMLNMLREEPCDSRLEALDAAVMAGLARRRESGMTQRGLALAGLVAVVVGVTSSLAAQAPRPAQPLLGVPDAAPSHLLAG
jgi:hypothetical protein